MPSLLTRLSRPAPLSWAATTLAVLWLGGRDALGKSPAAALYLLGGAACFASALWLVEWLWMRLAIERVLRRCPRLLGLALIGLAPAAYLILVPGRSLFESGLGWVLPAALVAGLLGAWLQRWLARRSTEVQDPRFVFGSHLSALELMLLFIGMHRAEDTFVQLRPGSEALHVLLFLGTWLVSILLFPSWSMRVHARVAAQPVTRLRGAICAVAGVVGLAAIEIDRRALVDLYPAVHVWLEVVGLLGLDAALAPLLGAVLAPKEGQPGRRLAAWVAAGAGVALVALSVGFGALLRSPRIKDSGVRAEVLDAALGPALIELAPRPERKYRQHPLLRYEQFLDSPSPTNTWNIVLLSSDALRGDAIAAPGSRSDDKSPRVTRFAAERCAYFQQTYAPGSRTAIGMGALMLGRYSAYIDWDFVIWRNRILLHPERMSPEERQALGNKFGYTTLPRIPPHGNLARRLKGAGFRTLAVPWDAFAAFFDRGQGFDEGFDVYADLRRKRWRAPSSSTVVAHALEQLDKQARRKKKYRRFFQWIHLFDTHEADGDLNLYRTRVRETDAAIGELLDGLRSRKLLDRTVFVLVADHGEAFGEHRATRHGTDLHEEQVRVPMLLCIPGVPPQIHHQPVSTLDAVATLLMLARADVDSIDGVNLMPLLLGRKYPERRPVFTELHRYKSNKIKRTSDLRAVRLGNWKLIKDFLRGSSKLYDIAHDPGERHNLIGDEHAVADELGAVLDAFVAEGERTHPLVGLERGRVTK